MSTPRDRIEAKLGLAGPPLRQVRDVPPRVPDHELIRRIGQGSYGEVWLARNALGTWRAVKIVYRDSFKDARPYEREFAGIRRFEPLSRANEGLVDILQVGRDDAKGWFYYVMELADHGEMQNAECRIQNEMTARSGTSVSSFSLLPSTLESYIPRTLSRDLQQRGRLPLEDCLQLGLTLSLALGHLHRHGLIHRDIKPSNIIFVGGVPKLADIGLVTESAGANTFVGTEGFVPPEGPTSPQADIYALGKVLYEAAMGKDRNEFPEPFTQISTDRESVALMELNTILLRACAPNAKARYASAEEMHADLALLHSGGSVKRRHQFERQFRIAKQVGAVAIAAVLMVGAAWFWQHRQTDKMTRLAEEKAALATEKTTLADNLTKLSEENRQRIVRLDVANGVRLLDEGDSAGALLWFADALPLVTNKPAEESIHRIRIRQTLNQTPRLLQVFPHENKVFSFAFSQDGERIVTGTEWGELRVWNARTGEALMKPLALDVDQVWQTRFMRDGQRVFASSLRPHGFAQDYLYDTNIAAIIDVKTGRRVVSLHSGTNLVRADLSLDERWLVTADRDNVIRIHDARDGRPVADLKGHTDLILVFSFSTNGNVLASSSVDRTVRLWRLPSGEPIGLPIQFARERGPVTLSQDGRLLATAGLGSDAGTNSIIEFWDVETGARVGAPIEMAGSPGAVGFLPPDEQRLLISTDQDNGFFDRRSHVRLLPSIKIERGFRTFAISPDGQRIALSGAVGLMGVWSLESGELVLPPGLHKRDLAGIEFSPDGTQLLAAGDDGAALLLGVRLPQESASYRFDAAIDKRPLTILLMWRRFSPDRRYFLLRLTDGTLRLVDFEQMTDQRMPADQFKGLWPVQMTFDTSGHRGAILYGGAGTNLLEIWGEVGGTTNRFVIPHPVGFGGEMLFTLDGRQLITPGGDGQIRFWRTADGTLQQSMQIQSVGSPMLFPDGHTGFGAVAATRGFALFDLATSSTLALHLPPMNVTGLRFDSTGERVATVGEVNWSRVWNSRNFEPLSPPLFHGGEVRWVDWSPDDKQLVTAGLTPEAKVWDASTGEQLLPPLRLGSKPLETALWSLDGRFIVARSDENTVRVWDAATGEPVTPILQHNSYVQLARMVANNRLITLSLPNLMRAWDLTETPLSTDVIADYAKLVSGRRFKGGGVTVPATPSELAICAAPCAPARRNCSTNAGFSNRQVSSLNRAD